MASSTTTAWPKGPDLARLIPHQGRMCLLAQVDSWDATAIRCASAAHRDPLNPLRRQGRLAAVCTVELALQAMALHGALTAGRPQPQGFVTSLRDVLVAEPFADHLPSPLRVEAALLAAESHGQIYRFTITAAGLLVVSGQAAIHVPETQP